MPWGNAIWGIDRWGEESLRSVTIDSIMVIAKDVILLTLSKDVVIDSGFNTIGNYLIENLSGNNDGIVASVLPTIDENETDKIFLEVKELINDDQYKITIANNALHTSRGTPLGISYIKWLMHKTKVDSAMGSFARLYKTSIRSTLRSIIEAMMISDEQIGGDF